MYNAGNIMKVSISQFTSWAQAGVKNNNFTKNIGKPIRSVTDHPYFVVWVSPNLLDQMIPDILHYVRMRICQIQSDPKRY